MSTNSKKIEVTGGFYSEEDMKKELGYGQWHVGNWPISPKHQL